MFLLSDEDGEMLRQGVVVDVVPSTMEMHGLLAVGVAAVVIALGRAQQLDVS